MEVVITLAVMSVLAGITYVSIFKFLKIHNENETKERQMEIAEAFIEHYYTATDSARKTWWNWYNGRAPLPTVKGVISSGEGETIEVYLDQTRLRLRELGCQETASVSPIPGVTYYEYVCPDAFGRNMRFSVSGQRERKNLSNGYLTGYFNPEVPVQYSVRSAGHDGSFGTGDDIVYSFSTSEADTYLIQETKKIFKDIADAAQRFVQQRMAKETIDLAYGNSLSSYDDSKVPWVWQALAQDPAGGTNAGSRTRAYMPCEMDTSSCRATGSCDCFSNATGSNSGYDGYVWVSVANGIWGNVKFRFLQNIGLCPEGSDTATLNQCKPYMMDATGQWLAIDVTGACNITSTAGTGLSWSCGSFPPVPSDNYSWDGHNPPYVTKICTTWGYCYAFPT